VTPWPILALLTVAAAGVALAPPVAAASAAEVAGWYAGASIGQSKTHDYSVGGPVDNVDDTDFAWMVSGGYTFMRNFALALSYADLGTTNADGPAFGGFTDELSAKGWNFSAVGILPVHERIGITGMVGFFRWSQDVHYVDPSGTYNYDDSGTSPSYGIGALFGLGPDNRMGIQVGWQRFSDVGDEDNSGHEMDRDFYSVGFGYRF
jgi:hypothetical protein